MTSTKSRSKNGQKVKIQDSKPNAKNTGPLIACFQHLAKRELFFHSIFFTIALASLVAFGFFFSFLADSFVMGIFIAFFFFAAVLYFVLRLYFQEQKPAQLQLLRDEYMAQFSEDPIQLAEIATSCAHKLDNAEISFYSLPRQIEFLRPQLEKLWRACHWKDVHLFKELFLRFAIEQKVKLVQQTPTEPQSHAELADAYLALAEHFLAPISSIKPSASTRQKLQQRFLHFSKLGLEELQIVTEYAPNDLWVHAKMAATYHSLGMIEKAMSQYEAILHLNPQDIDSLYALGQLYFTQGMHGKGLKIYERLETLSPAKAQNLLASYGTA